MFVFEAKIFIIHSHSILDALFSLNYPITFLIEAPAP